ncbi:serine O-acetyltransferase [Aliiroseovarius crassostreae]|uniref:serine O-acetyltransferase n=1 Tax=Aliiroseovarius crassostreae TaxID=154981 RepID=UPI0021FDC7D0|nr:serine O-acetyltransferase [Aliiroseovarius crassostreae]UWP98929.1 serine O-acetyltransferase [Aliiroseovarius crassostreae]
MNVDHLLEKTIHELFPVGDRAPNNSRLQKSTCEHALSVLADVLPILAEDLCAYVQKDPSLEGQPAFALVPHSPFIATLCYRIAHALWSDAKSGEHTRDAMAISHFARSLTGVEIHPAATIGKRFVLDHGTNTVIGATCEIGSDCYILNGVVLGARGIAGNDARKRHPTIGNRVQIGAFARVLGDVHIGDDCFICPWSLITRDVVPDTIVKPQIPTDSFSTHLHEAPSHVT